MKIRLLAAAAAALLTLTVGAHATVLYSDSFDADALKLGTSGSAAVPSGWTVAGGTVDIIGAGGGFDFLPGNGHYIDLDGSSGAAGTLSKTFNVVAGTYYVTFELAGNHRNGDDESTTVTFGQAGHLVADIYTPSENAGFTTYTLSVTTTGGPLRLSFHDASADNVGALLDNITVGAVPEPESLPLMAAGLLTLGFIARRRRG